MRRLSWRMRLWIIAALLIWSAGGWHLYQNPPDRRDGPVACGQGTPFANMPFANERPDGELEEQFRACLGAAERRYQANKAVIDAANAARERDYKLRGWRSRAVDGRRRQYAMLGNAPRLDPFDVGHSNYDESTALVRRSAACESRIAFECRRSASSSPLARGVQILPSAGSVLSKRKTAIAICRTLDGQGRELLSVQSSGLFDR